MPRTSTLILLLPLLVQLYACSAWEREPTPLEVPQESRSYPGINQWLELHRGVQGMSTEEVVADLVNIQRPEGISELYYYALLNQKLNNYGGWIQARDAFTQLQDDSNLPAEHRQLADILRQTNQDRINWHFRRAELRKNQAQLEGSLTAGEAERVLLQQKLKALTDLEAAISTRKEE